MSIERVRIVFMGTPDYALASLEALYNSGANIVGVVTQPDKPKGRGYVLTPPPVKVFAQEKNIPVYQPATLKNGAFDEEIARLNPDLIVVVAFGKILPLSVLEYPKYGCINVHGSLLPEYRGAAPMQRAIIDGKPVTGVTTMYMAEGLDTGDMLLKDEVAITEDDNFESIHDKLAACGAQLLLRTIEELLAGTLHPEKQDDSKSTYARKIEKTDCLIDFAQPVSVVHNQIRGLSPIPVSFTHTPDGKLLKVISSKIVRREGPLGQPGTVLSLDQGIEVACLSGSIMFTRVVPEGKGQMSAEDYIRGRKLQVGDQLQ